jgi:hypothetical protein
MMPEHPRILTDDAFKRLQTYAEPFVDSVSTVVLRMFDHFDATSGGATISSESCESIVTEMRQEMEVVQMRLRKPGMLRIARGGYLPIGLQMTGKYNTGTA